MDGFPQCTNAFVNTITSQVCGDWQRTTVGGSKSSKIVVKSSFHTSKTRFSKDKHAEKETDDRRVVGAEAVVLGRDHHNLVP